MTSKEHKITAKETLNGNWGLAISLLLTSFVLPMALMFIPILGIITVLIFTPAITYVPMQLFLRLKRKDDIKKTDFFKYALSNRLGKYWLICLYVGLIIFAVTMLTMVLSSLISQALFNVSEFIGTIGSTVLIIITYIIILYFGFQYSQVAYIMLDNPQLKVREIAKKSSELMKGNILKLVCLYLSFIGWFILCALTCGLAYFYVLPYFHTTLASFYDELSGNNNYTSSTNNDVVQF